MLRIEGAHIVDEEGRPMLLRGFGLGGWMNMENFITGYPGSEENWRVALLGAMGQERYDLFFERFLTYFFMEDDAAYLASLGLNCLRLPINYRHFESDMQPFEIRGEGFRHLDRVIELCARHGIYTVIDLHAVQGWQNEDWHSDNSTHRALLWTHRQFQDRAVHLWETIAERYRGNRWVAGYNLINEPNDQSGRALIPVTRRIYDAVRAVDPDHLIFLDGGQFGSNIALYEEPWPGVVYSIHDYALPGFKEGGEYPGYTKNVWCDRAFLERHFLHKSEFTRLHGLPVWVGEFGPLYSGDERDAMRYVLAREQIETYQSHGASWSLWTYKDIGPMGLVYTAPDSPWMRLLGPSLEKKARLGLDSWTTTDTTVRDVIGPLEARMNREFPDSDPIPMGTPWLIERLVRSILFAEALLPEFAALFKDLGEEEIDALAASWRFDQCVKREGLAEVIRETGSEVAVS